MQIIISGMHRSGTSCVARLLNMMGVYFAPESEVMPPQEDNYKGFWERRDVIGLNDSILQAGGGRWDQIGRFSWATIDDEQRARLQKEIQTLVLSMDGHRPWFIKDPRMCLLHSYWLPFLEVPLNIFVYRDPLQVAMSLQKRNGFPLSVGIGLWEYYLCAACQYLDLNSTIVMQYESLMESPVTEVGQLFAQLQSLGVPGLRLPSELEITSFVDPKLFHMQAKADIETDVLTGNQRDIVAYFEQRGGYTDYPDFSMDRVSVELLEQYAKLQDEQEGENGLLGEVETDPLKTIIVEKKLLERACQDLEERQQQDAVLLQVLREEIDQLKRELRILRDDHFKELVVIRQERDDELVDLGRSLKTQIEIEQNLKTVQLELKSEQGENTQLHRWLVEIQHDVQAAFGSMRWKVGDTVIRSIELLLLRFNKKTARHHLEVIFAEYNSSQSGQTVGESVQSAPVTMEAIFSRFVFVALRNPRQTIQLLTFKRLRNLYITLFKQSSHVQRNIFDYYLQLYGAKTNDSDLNLGVSLDYKMVDETGFQPMPIPAHANPQVSIIIPCYNQWHYTRKCIQAIISVAQGLSYEIILADDQSEDETIHGQAHFPGLKIVKTPENIGFLKNCNHAATTAHGEFIVFVNNDTVAHENWLQGLLAVFSGDSTVGLVGSQLLFPDGSLQEAGGIIWQDGSGWNYGRGDDPTKAEYNYIREVDYLSGASLMVRSSVWRELGGFDERYAPAYYEDTDLAFAVRAAGYKSMYTPFSVMTHFEGQSYGNDTPDDKPYQQANRIIFAEKWADVLRSDQYQSGESIFQARGRTRHKKTLLVVDHYVPHYDKDAGSRSTFQYLQWFVEQGLDVKFIGDNFHHHEPYTSDLQRMGIEVLYGPFYAENWRQWLRKNGGALDYVYLHRPHIGLKYIDAVRQYTHAKIIYFGHDLHYLRTERQYEVEKRDELQELAQEWRRQEFALFGKVDVIYYPSSVEVAEVKKQFPEKCVRAIPLNIYDFLTTTEPSLATRKDLMFIGGFVHEPNLDGVLWFVQEIFPLIQTQLPEIKFIIAGSKVPPSVVDLQSESIIVAGEISDIELHELYQKSRISVVPLRYGAGVKGKVLEALLMQVPVVTSEIGAEGVPLPHDYLQVAKDANEFAEKVVQVYTDDALWCDQVRKGIGCLNRYFSKKRVEEILSQDFELL